MQIRPSSPGCRSPAPFAGPRYWFRIIATARLRWYGMRSQKSWRRGNSSQRTVRSWYWTRNQSTFDGPGLGAKKRYGLERKVNCKYGWKGRFARTANTGAGKPGPEAE